MAFNLSSNAAQMINTPTKVLIQIVIALVIFLGLVWITVPVGGTPLFTLLATYLCALIAFVYVLLFMRRAALISMPLVLVAAVIFTVKVVLGVFHYLLFIDGGYFYSDAPEFSYLWDYEWLNYSMSKISEYWSESGFGFLPTEFWLDNKNTLLMPYLALLYYLAGNEHFLNITVLNSLHNVLVAVMVAGFAATVAPKRVVTASFIIALLQPFGLFSSIMWRDSVGQSFFIAGAILIAQFGGKFRELIKPLLGCLLMMSLRNVYLILGMMSVVVGVMSINRKRGLAFYSGFIGISVLLVVIFPYLNNLVFEFYAFDSPDLTHAAGALSIPKKILTAFIGPFPWVQILDPSVPGWEYLLPDILQSMFSMTIWYLVLRGLVRNKIRWDKAPYTVTLALVLLTTLVGALSYGHVSYVTVATVLLLPIIPNLTLRRFISLWASFTGVIFVAGVMWAFL